MRSCRAAPPKEASFNVGQLGWQDEQPVPEMHAEASHGTAADPLESQELNLPGKAYPRTPQPSLIAAAPNLGRDQGFSFSEVARAFQDEPSDHEADTDPASYSQVVMEARAPEDAHAQAAASSPAGKVKTAAEGRLLKRYTSDIGGSDGMAAFASSMDERPGSDEVTQQPGSHEVTRQQRGGEVTQPAADGASKASETTMQPVTLSPGQGMREMRRVTSDIGGGQELADFAQSLQSARAMRRVTSDIGGGEGLADLAQSLQAVPEAEPVVRTCALKIHRMSPAEPVLTECRATCAIIMMAAVISSGSKQPHHNCHGIVCECS